MTVQVNVMGRVKLEMQMRNRKCASCCSDEEKFSKGVSVKVNKILQTGDSKHMIL